MCLQGYDLRAHLAQILNFSDEEGEEDLSSDDDYSIESFENDERDDELIRVASQPPDERYSKTPLPTGVNNQALVPISGMYVHFA